MSVSEKYILSHPAFGDREVSRSEYIAAERAAGFRPKSGNDDDLATGSFSGGGIEGRVEHVTDEDLSQLIEKVSGVDISPGNFIVVRVASYCTPGQVQQLVQQIRRIVPVTCSLAVLQGDESDISALSDDSMLAQGWVRAPTPAKEDGPAL